MIKGIGIDIIDIPRVAKAVEKESFVSRVFTIRERDYCQGRGASGAASFAGRFAAKEAVMKAMGTGLRYGKLTDIEITNDELGCPLVSLSGAFAQMAQDKGVSKIWLSISHSKDYATAQCVFEGP